MDYKLMFQFIYHLFSFKRSSRRFFSFYRITVVIILFPIFASTLIINRIFLLLDYIIFPFFTLQKIISPVFIISLPRTGTTFLLHSLAADNQFSKFKLWELLFAPSIMQKYIFILLNRIDNFIFSPIKMIILFFEKILIGNFKQIHILGLNEPEEDDLVLLWNFSTLYFMFFSPDSNIFDSYADFSKMSHNKRNRIMNYYYKCIQRHEFVFNQNQKKRFLSKNPLMIPKLPEIQKLFEDSKIITIIRNLEDVIASTISMNEIIYNSFSRGPSSSDWINKSIDILIDWQKKLNTIPDNIKLNISFENITNFEDLHFIDEKISGYLKISNRSWLQNEIKSARKTSNHKSKHRHFNLSDEQLKKIKYTFNVKL